MNVLRDKISHIATTVMILLAAVGVLICVRVTITVVERQEQEVRNIAPVGNEAAQVSARLISIGKISDQKIYFNGMEVDSISAYSTDKRETLVSLDDILSYIGTEYKFYAPDDLVEAQVSGKTLAVQIGKDSFKYDGKEIKLPYAPITAKGHILVPIEMFSYIDGFSQDQILTDNLAFVNYFGDMKFITSPYIRLLRLNLGFGGIWDLTGSRSLWGRDGNYGDEEMFEASPDGNLYSFRSGDKVYLLNPDIDPNPYLINADAQFTWSEDSKNLFWEDNSSGMLFIYNIEKDIKYSLENFLWRADNIDGYEGFSRSSKKLIGFDEHGSYRKLSFKGLYTHKVYTMIQKNSRIIAEGAISYSPNGRKIVFSKQDGGYYVANYDGTGVAKLGYGVAAEWVTNSKILVYSSDGMLLYDASGKVRYVGEKLWEYLGQALDGTVFYTDGETLYSELDGVEKSIMTLPWECDYVTAVAGGGPYMMVSTKEDGVFYSTSKGTTKVGSYSAMLKGSISLDNKGDYRRNIMISPDKDSFLLLQKENNLLTLKIMAWNSDVNKKVVLDYTVPDIPIPDNIKVKQIDGHRVLLYTDSELWLVDFRDNVQIYEYKEKENCSIEGVLVP